MPRAAPIRVAVIGLGAAARDIVLPALRALPVVEVVGGSDPDPLARQRATRVVPLPTLTSDAPTLLTRTRPDVVAIATPPATHRDLALLALAYGCHIFCEKPLAASVAEADTIIAAAARAERLVVVNNQYRQMAIYRAARRAARAAGGAFLATVTQTLYHPPAREAGWRGALRERVLFEFGTHPLDLLTAYFDAYPTAVSARVPDLPLTGGTDALTVLRLDFPGERVATLTLNRLSHAPARYLDLRLDCPAATVTATLGGAARGEAAWSPGRRWPAFRLELHGGGEARLERAGRSRVLAREWRPPFAPATARHFARFLAALDRGEEPEGAAGHARELLRVVEAAYASARAGGELVRLEAPC